MSPVVVWEWAMRDSKEMENLAYNKGQAAGRSPVYWGFTWLTSTLSNVFGLTR